MTSMKYSFSSNLWTRIPHNLNQHRGSHGAVALDDKIFAIGGGGLSSNLASTEMLESRNIEAGWTVLSSMRFSRHAHSLVLAEISQRYFIFAIGGTTSGTTGYDKTPPNIFISTPYLLLSYSRAFPP